MSELIGSDKFSFFWWLSLYWYGRAALGLVEDGFAKLQKLKDVIHNIWCTCGNLHWATPTDVVMLGEACQLGFLIFSSRRQGNGRWLYGFNPRRGDFQYWITLYCINNAHFKVLQFQRVGTQDVCTYWPITSLPVEFQRQYDVCNSNCPVGSGYGLGIS